MYNIDRNNVISMSHDELLIYLTKFKAYIYNDSNLTASKFKYEIHF